MAELQNSLPYGWDRLLDKKSGRYYFINHYNKTTTWDDPRYKARRHPSVVHVSNTPTENIPLQHGSPEFRRNYVYPSQNTPIIAFQMPANCSPKSLLLQDLQNASRSGSRTARLQDTSLTTASTEDAVTKISAMFPTVSDTHIRLLLKKYHNREALVISALQVEKHPITTPGPFATPPPTRNIHPSVYAPLQMTPPLSVHLGIRGGSPILRPGSGSSNSYPNECYRNSPKPHSPKLKLRYMKSIFPKADETVILDILISNDNNIQKASDVLKEMGYEKRDSTKSLSHQLTPKPEAINIKREPTEEAPSTSMQRKSLGDKRMITAQLQEKYKDIPEQVIIIALESVGYDKERANHILYQMVQEESDKQANVNSSDAEKELTEVVTVPQAVALTISTSQSRQSLKSLLKTEKNDSVLKDICSFSRVVEEPDKTFCYRSENLTGTCGANKNLAKGANQELLLEDYVKWQGSQPSLHKGPQRGLAKGSNSALLITRNYQPCGSNSELQKGPQSAYVKGSFLLHMKRVAVAESRGK